MDKYYYELKYIYNDLEVTHKFPTDLDINELADNLKYFLLGCSWTEKQVNELINGGEY